MECQIELVDGIAIVQPVADTLDANNSHRFRDVIAPVIADASHVVLNLSRLNFIDSAGLGALISCSKRLKAKGGDLLVFGIQHQIKSLFEMTRMHQVFSICATQQDAFDTLATLH